MSSIEENVESINPKVDNGDGDDKAKMTTSTAAPTEQQDHKAEADEAVANKMMKIECSSAVAADISLNTRMNVPDSDTEYRQWLQSMLQVARLPGGLPTEFRRKLWLALAERYLKRKKVDWEIEKIKWFSESWRADDEELATQIVKDLHRTGHSMLAGDSGQLYQSKLKKILMGYSRWNPEVGYCQGFNMLGAIILQVMGKCEVDSIKVMIFLIEGLLPNGYFSGGLIGLQADMAVFRELLGYKLPKLAKHLERLQSSTQEPSFEPPIINVFTMQWFLTLFCNCLPMSYVLRIWDLIMIEGSDILLRAALSIWKMLEDRILREVLTADDFYCKMETLSAELLNGTLIDSNRLIHMISSLGPINNLQQLRQKHLTASLNDQKRLKMLYSNAEKQSRLTVRRGSQPIKGQTDREKIALDITVLKKQYDKLRERQKQAHIILSSAVTKQQQQQQQQSQQNLGAGPSNVNKLLVGKNAIVSKGRKGPPKGAIPPARTHQRSVKGSQKSSKPEETIQWKNIEEAKRRNSMTWKEINSERRKEELKKSSSASSLRVDLSSPKRRSDSSSYSEESDNESSPSTSLCDEDAVGVASREKSPLKKKRVKDLQIGVSKPTLNIIEEASPVSIASAIDAKLTQDCPEISIADDDGCKSVSPNTRFYLDLPTNFGTNSGNSDDITSTAQLSPLPDLSNYFTAISPIKTPCGFFDLPAFNSFMMSSDEKYQVNDDGVTNEFFARCYEDNLTSSIIDKSPEVSSTSPSSCNLTAKKSSFNKQKSLSMDEKTLMSENNNNEEVVVINRSFSDGTVGDNIDDFQRIIAENTKMLNKLIPRCEENRLTIVEESSKSPTNLSDVEEEEIAAIDKKVDDDVDRVLLSDIQDIENIRALALNSGDEEKTTIKSEKVDGKVEIMSSYNSTETTTNEDESNVTTMAIMLLAAAGEERNENECGISEKSIMRDENEETDAQATPILSLLENSAAVVEEKKKIEEGEEENFQTKSEHCNPPSTSKARVEDEERKIESPKFNEIQLMVIKLKEEMESQMKSCGDEVVKSEGGGGSSKKELEEKVIEELKEKISSNENLNQNQTQKCCRGHESAGVEVEKVVSQSSSSDVKEIEIEKITKKTTGKVVQIAIIVESEENGHVREIENSSVEFVEKKAENCSEKLNEKKIDEKPETTTPPNGDLEQTASKPTLQKIDNNDDSSSVTTTTTTTVTTTKTTCETCQRRQKEETDSKLVVADNKLDECQQQQQQQQQQKSTKCDSPREVNSNENSTNSSSVVVDKKNENDNSTQTTTTITKKSEKCVEKECEMRKKSEKDAVSEVKKVDSSTSTSPIVTVPTPILKKQSESIEKKDARKKESIEAEKAEKMEKMNREIMRIEKATEIAKNNVKETFLESLTNQEKTAVMELAEMIKEREIEKLNEMKKLAEEFHREMSVSPVRSLISKSNRSSPTESIMSSSSRLYDHEPRSDLRRRDIISSLENEQRTRKPFNRTTSPRRSSSSPPSNIKETLDSIQTTIKYLDHCCKHPKSSETRSSSNRRDRTPTRKYERVYDNYDSRAPENDFSWMPPKPRYHSPSSNYDNEISPMRMSSSSYDDNYYRDRRDMKFSKHHTFDDNDMMSTRYSTTSPIHERHHRRYDRSLSPKKNRYDYDDSMSLSSSSFRSRNISSVSPSRYTPRTPEADNMYFSRIRGMTTDEYMTTKSDRLGGSRDRLNTLTSSRSPYSSREYLYKSPLGGSRERLNVSSSFGSRTPLGGSRDRLNIGGSSRCIFSDSRERLSTFGSRDRLNMSTTLKSPYASSERLNTMRTTTITGASDTFDRFYSSKSPLGGSRERLNASKSNILGSSREGLSQSYLCSSRDRLNAITTKPYEMTSKSPANDNFEKFYTSKSPVTVNRDKVDMKYGIDRSPTSDSLSTHVSRAPTKSPVQISASTSSFLKFPSDERTTSSTKVPEVSPSKFVRFDPNPIVKSRSPIEFDSPVSSIIDKNTTTTSYSNSTYKPKAKDDEWNKPSSSSISSTRKFDF